MGWLRNNLFPPGKQEVNILFFFFYFLLLLSMGIYQLYFWKVTSYVFIIHAIGQAFLEAGIFFVIACALNRYTPRWLFSLFVGVSFVILFLQFISYTLVRFMDVRLPHFMKYVFGAGIKHFLLETESDQNGTVLPIIILLLTLGPILGYVLYRLSTRVSKITPWHPSIYKMCLALYGTAMALTITDLFGAHSIDYITYQKYKKALPFASTFIPPHPSMIPLTKHFAKVRNEEITVKNMEAKHFEISDKPNIFLFVIESLRKDFVTDQTAPNLLQFSQENYSFPESYANANCTHTSWLAIFHSDVPYYWTKMQHSWKGGSIPLRILKECGYKINVLASSNIHTFNMDKLLFGKNHELLNSLHECLGHKAAYECDANAMKELNNILEPNGNVYIVFIDSTHAKYSVPDDYPLKFEPVTDHIDYLRFSPKTIEMIKNRYRNSISYVDSLFANFFNTLKEKGLYDDAIIAITADHGEEFFEDGAMFHGMHLNVYQTSAPLYYKFGQSKTAPNTNFTTHLDIFPSILQHLTGRSDFADLFDGQSIFAQNRWLYRIAVMQNGTFSPNEFTISKGKESYYFRFPETRDISKNKDLEVLSSPPPSDLNTILGPLLNSSN